MKSDIISNDKVYDMPNLVYFSAADRQMENFLDEDAFDRSLLLNVLFQPGILVPDILFVISGGLEAHLQNPELTFFEACIEEGRVIPSFRDARASSFVDSLRLIRHQAIQGVRDSADGTVRRLQLAADRNKTFCPVVPKTHLGASFEKRLAILQEDEPPIIGPTFGMSMSQGELQKYWLLTKHWRLNSIDQARENTRNIGNELGLRRGEIINSVARDLLSGSQAKIDDIGILFAAHPDKPELRVFFQWVCEIYAYNHAIEMDCIPNLPAHNALSVVSLGMASLAPPPVMQYASFPSISEMVTLPPLRVLKRANPRELLAIRREKGAQYLADLTAWQADPINTARNAAVRKSLRDYTAKIVKWSKTDIQSPVRVMLSHLPPASRWWAALAGTYGLNLLRESDPAAAAALGSFVAVATCGYAIYQGLYQKPQQQKITLVGHQPWLGSEVNILEPRELGES